ncbi:MAG: protoporphyrinogen oxidase [Chloroflexi bacterium]|nr:protoporphyrinogen oxidase [Chloroflexota bacterium]
MHPTSSTHHVAIIGGGIAGLSTAYYLQRQAAATGATVSYTVLEAAPRWGGHILTETVETDAGRFVVEGGPDSFITQKPWGVQLARELGLGDRLLGTNDAMRKVFVLNRGKPTPMPDGVLLIVPTKFMPFVRSPLISPLGKLRMGLDLLIPPKRDGQDETLADFVRRRLGAEALDKIAEPLLSGIYNSEADRQSLLATFPRFRDLEVKYGSLTRGMLASRRNGHSPQPGAGGQKPLSVFMSLAGGTGELVDALVAQLTDAPSTGSGQALRLHTPVERLARRSEGDYLLSLAGGETLRADAVVLAVPAYTAQALAHGAAPEVAVGLGSIRYVSTGTISLAYRLADIRRPLLGFGLVVPSSERRPANAVTWSSLKFNGRAPEGYALLRVFFGGSRSPQSMALDDDALLATVRGQLREFMGIEAAPLFHRIYRWERSNAQYDVGHLERVAALEAALPPGLHLTGSPYRGVGLPDCIKQGQETAGKVIGEWDADERG